MQCEVGLWEEWCVCSRRDALRIIMCRARRESERANTAFPLMEQRWSRSQAKCAR